MLDRPSPLGPRAEEDQAESADQKARRDNIGEDAEVGIAIALHEIHPHQQRKREQCADGDDCARGADPVVEMRPRLRHGGARGLRDGGHVSGSDGRLRITRIHTNRVVEDGSCTFA